MARSTAPSSRSPAATRWRTGPPRFSSSSASCCPTVPEASAAGSPELSWLTAVQRVLEFLLRVLGQGRLQDRAAVLAHRLDGLVGGDLLQHQEQRRGARLEHAADLVLELLVDAGLGELAHERAHPGAD